MPTGASGYFLANQLEHLPKDERKEGIEILLGHVRGLARIPNLAEMVVDTVGTIIKKMYASEKQVIATITQLLNYEGKELPKIPDNDGNN